MYLAGFFSLICSKSQITNHKSQITYALCKLHLSFGEIGTILSSYKLALSRLIALFFFARE